VPTASDAPHVPLLSFDAYGAGIGAAATVLRANATSSAPDAPVPTCPGWSGTDLVAHVGMVHRWCTDTLRGVRSDPAGHEAAGRRSADLLQWFDDGATELLDVLSKTPEDWDGSFFLKNTPDARTGWARRQCHETTIHAVDAMAARLGRLATSDEVWFPADLAVDGVDELLMGFVPRRSSRLRASHPVTIEIVAGSADGSGNGHRALWTVSVSDEPPVVMRAAVSDPDLRWSAPARELYLALWNRGGGITVDELTGRGRDSRALWTELMRVTWS
jgi:uncharacterized protein (TIGR03083 family)